MISQFDESGAREDINRLIEAVLRRVTLRGFIVRDHEEARPEFEQTVSACGSAAVRSPCCRRSWTGSSTPSTRSSEC